MAPIQEEEYSLLHVERISQYVSLSPSSLNNPLPSLCASIFSPLLLSYFPPAKGVVLAYEDVSLSDAPPQGTSKKSNSQPQSQQDDEPLLLRHVDEYSAPFLWATASFLVFRPQRNAYINGRITHQSKTHITLSHLNMFPVSITKDHFPSSWTWHSEATGKVKKGWDGRLSDEGGWWIDSEGQVVGGDLKVRIRDFDGRMDGKGRGKGFLRIEGSLLSVAEEAAQQQKGSKGKAKVNGVLKKSQQAE